ncbi:hypothetical protein EBT16_07605 [bacterium]|nr:hypothetical protein [bacterium]
MPSKEQLLNEYLLSAMDTGKVEMKSPRAGKGGKALVTAAESVLPFVSAAKSALEGDYKNAMIQAGLDVALPPAIKGAAALGGKFLAPALAGAIKAYHGSPHKFDKFDMSKIGTGEGAQAFGHGLYFAESPKVAIGYQKRLSDATSPYTYKWEGSVYEGGVKGDPVAHALGLVYHQNKSTAQRIAKMGIEDAKRGEDYALDMGGVPYYEKMLETAKKVNRKDIKAFQGNLYETNLRWPDAAREAADPLSPHHFLDWDKPLSEQSHKVLSALENAGYKLGPSEREIEKYADDMLKSDAMNWADETGGDWVDFSNNADWDSYVDAARKQLGGVNPKTTGERFYQDLVKDFGYNSRLFEKPTEYSEGVAGHLHELGIPGIRYLDGGSRSAGEGTHNYVLFSDELADILKRNDEQLKAKGGKVEANAFPYGLRHDSELPKGKGYFGPMTTSSGDVMTEYSSSDDVGDYPLVVPTLTADEIRTLLSNSELTELMLEKAQGWADARRKMGKSPFAGSDELRLPVPKKTGGSTTKSVKKR